MSSLIAFVRRWDTLRATAPMGAGGQCVDLAQLWYTACGGPDHVYRDAAEWAVVRLSGFYWVPNEAANWPSAGDIVVWGRSARAGTMQQGHIAIAILADRTSLLTFDQDWPWGAACGFVHHPDYWGVRGWHSSIKPRAAPQESATGR